MAAFIDFPKPLIALVNGPAVGISVTTLALCDTVYCTDRVSGFGQCRRDWVNDLVSGGINVQCSLRLDRVVGLLSGGLTG